MPIIVKVCCEGEIGHTGIWNSGTSFKYCGFNSQVMGDFLNEQHNYSPQVFSFSICVVLDTCSDRSL